MQNQAYLCDYKVRLVYIVSSRASASTWKRLCLKINKYIIIKIRTHYWQVGILLKNKFSRDLLRYLLFYFSFDSEAPTPGNLCWVLENDLPLSRLWTTKEPLKNLFMLKLRINKYRDTHCNLPEKWGINSRNEILFILILCNVYIKLLIYLPKIK